MRPNWYVYNKSNILNVLYWVKYFEMVADVQGSIVECGVGRGRSLVTLLALQDYFDEFLKRDIYALDSFEGFPEPDLEDESPRKPQKGEWSKSPNKQFSYSINNLKKILQKADISQEKCTIIKGFFDKSTKDLNVKKIAILHLDGDLYNSVKQPLTNLASKVSINGIIVIDDFIENDTNQEKEMFPGARKAVEEFLVENNNYILKTSIRGTPYLVRLS